jgi:hypothetical protein
MLFTAVEQRPEHLVLHTSFHTAAEQNTDQRRCPTQLQVLQAESTVTTSRHHHSVRLVVPGQLEPAVALVHTGASVMQPHHHNHRRDIVVSVAPHGYLLQQQRNPTHVHTRPLGGAVAIPSRPCASQCKRDPRRYTKLRSQLWMVDGLAGCTLCVDILTPSTCSVHASQQNAHC